MPLLPRDPGGQGGGIEEAPLDGRQYGRQMAKWTPIEKIYTLLYYRGPFATPDELRAAHPTDIPGAYAVVSSTSSIWIWNHDKWEDTGATQTQAGILDAPHDGKTYGRKDGDWVEAGGGTVNEEQVINIIKNTQHNILKSIQGGKVEGGQVTEAYHLTREEWEGLPIRPFVMFPANNATDINQVPQIVGSPYAHPHDTLMYMKHIQIAKTSDFAAPVYDKEEVSRNITFQVPLKPDDSPYLEENTLYYVRIRYRDRRMRWSHWSAPIRFTTMKTFPMNVIVMPEMIIPADGGEASAFSPLLAMSTPKVVGGVGEFDKADWQISTDSTFATTLYDAQGTDDLITHIAQNLNLSVISASDFYARGRQRMTGGQYSPWARPVRFGLRPEFDEPVFGLRRVFSKKYGVLFLANIDENGEIVYISQRYWDRHPLYKLPRQDINLGKDYNNADVISEMVYFPPCWIKSHIYNNDDGDMVIDLWFSAQQREGNGWTLHPAFARSTSGFLYSKNFVDSKSVRHSSGLLRVYASLHTNSNNTSSRVPISQNYLSNLNLVETGSSQGNWHFETFYERMLILDLVAAELLTLRPDYNEDSEKRFTWRGVHVLQQYYSAFFGMKYVYEDNRITQIHLLNPFMTGAFSTILVDLPASTNLNAQEIARGCAPSLGFDLALLGIVNAVGDGVSPFGISGLDTRPYSDFPPYITPLRLPIYDLFGVAPTCVSGQYSVVASIGKWLE